MQMNFYLRIHSFSYIYDNTFTFPRFFKETKYLYFYVELFDKIGLKKKGRNFEISLQWGIKNEKIDDTFVTDFTESCEQFR